jgi:hypothetical protein
MRMKVSLGLLAFAMVAVTGTFAQDEPRSTGSVPQTSQAPSPTQTSPDAASAEKPIRIRIGANVTSAKITHMEPPVYPPIAKTAHVSGIVVLHCIIAKDGTILQVEYVSGPPLLLKAAMDSVRQWVYQPTLLNGKPVEVDTTVSVVFELGKKGSDDSDSPLPTSPSKAQRPDSMPTVVPAPASRPPVPIDQQFKADILHLMDVTQVGAKQEESMRKLFDSLRPQMLAELPVTPNREKILDAYIDKLVGVMQSDASTNRMIAAYAEHLTDADVKAALAFYETTGGQHYLESSKKLLPEMMMIGQQLVTEALPAIFQDLCKQFPELQGEAKFCGPPDPTKKSLLPDANPLPRGN